MSDGQYETFQQYGTDAERLAFVPDPAAGIQPIYIWYTTDTGITYVFDSSWHVVGGAGGGLPASVQGDLFYATGVNTVAALAKNASATRYLSNTGGSNNPAWAQVALATGVSGVLPVANGGTGSASGAAILRATVTLTNAQVLALPTAPQTIVAAPGSGFRINAFGYTLHASFAAGAYTGINAAAFLQFTNGISGSSYVANDAGGTPVLTTMNKLFGANVQVVQLLPWQATNDPALEWGILGDTAATATGDNTAIVLTVDNSGVDFGGGNAANTMRVIVYYTIEAFP